jgi:hypothetical protein
MSDENFYEQAADELRLGTADKGLAAKAFAKAEGDDRRANAAYMELRVTQLKAAAAAKHGKELAQKTARIGGEVFKPIAGICLGLAGTIFALYLMDAVSVSAPHDKILPQLVELVRPTPPPIPIATPAPATASNLGRTPAQEREYQFLKSHLFGNMSRAQALSVKVKTPEEMAAYNQERVQFIKSMNDH